MSNIEDSSYTPLQSYAKPAAQRRQLCHARREYDGSGGNGRDARQEAISFDCRRLCSKCRSTKGLTFIYNYYLKQDSNLNRTINSKHMAVL